MMELDEVLNTKVNPCGRYQVFVIALMSTAWFVSPFSAMGISFIAATPDHRCRVAMTSPNHTEVNATRESILRMYIPTDEDGSLDQCKVRHIYHNFILKKLSIGSFHANSPKIRKISR